MNRKANFSTINSWMQSYLDQDKFVGSSVLIAVDNKVIHKNYVGLRKKNAPEPFDFETVVKFFP